MEEGHNISEAAYASGFNDLGYFRSCFREEYGMAPSEYIRLRKSQD
jgi:AraC-like DNA-binding protein